MFQEDHGDYDRKCPRKEDLSWINNALESKFKKLEDLCTGAAYCQLYHYFFPHLMDLRKVVFFTNLKADAVKNFLILQEALHRRQEFREIPFSEVTKHDYASNLEFYIWFKQFFDNNFKDFQRIYYPLEERFNLEIGYGEPKEKSNESLTYVNAIHINHEKPRHFEKALRKARKQFEVENFNLEMKYSERNLYLRKIFRVQRVCRMYPSNDPFIKSILKITRGVTNMVGVSPFVQKET
ncbi:microtubule-associated protein RP/EB family member 3-like [Teleopsis dalmanni]|uniref:microtubule-associated protein RP/EB family member 3-like n=1 Tax=Teleopsis dalmanni TaxID=139649 RepID=UPI0018CF5B03|nr:microtubule-associated protein RP/EB family member 3-like [Teleopsis dalmanni]